MLRPSHRAVIPGPERSEGIHNHSPRLWIAGSRLRRAPEWRQIDIITARAHPPSLEQRPRPRPRMRMSPEEARQILGGIDIERDARQLQHFRFNAAAPGRGEMRQKAV